MTPSGHSIARGFWKPALEEPPESSSSAWTHGSGHPLSAFAASFGSAAARLPSPSAGRWDFLLIVAPFGCGEELVFEGLDRAVVVAVAVVGMVEMAADKIVHMIAMRDGFVAAIRAMNMGGIVS